jgi:hypothetical protein
MQHSVKQVGEEREKLSSLRNDKNKFNANDFFLFAKENKETYHLIEQGNDFLVSTWYSDSLINDYKSQIK